MKVDQLHMIIHPGFASESDDQAIKQHRTPLGSGEVMRQRYVEGLRRTSKSDLAFAFLHLPPSELENQPEDSHYKRLIDDMRDVMGDRLLLHGNGRLDLKGVGEDFGQALTTARLRGFIIDESTPTLSYGETLQCCVSRFANNANLSAKFKSPTIVDTKRCDRDIIGGVDSMAFLKEIPTLRKEFSRLQYQM